MSTTISGAVAGRVIASLLMHGLNKLSQKAATRLQAYYGEKQLEDLQSSFADISKIKTLFRTSEPIALDEIYYPSRIQLDENRPVKIESIGELPFKNYVIEGKAGQGKSVFLRYLASRELRNGDKSRVPIFVELRFLSKERDLLFLIKDRMIRMGILVNDELLIHYLSNSKIILCLDGFDEIGENFTTNCVNDLEGLISKFPSTQILVTARPLSGIQNSPHFRVLKLADLAGDDIKPFIFKVSRDKDLSEILAVAIKSNKMGARNLVTTPLLLTLLVLLYGATQKIPDTLPEFYHELFNVLLYKHDLTKAGFKRDRFLLIGEQKVKELFQAFSFVATVRDYLSFTAEQLHACIEQASELTKLPVNSDDFRNELTKTACILLEDGTLVTFIHKSIREFYAASFVMKSRVEFAEQFYSKAITSWPHWRQELIFLNEIDPYRYARYFFIPAINKFITDFSGLAPANFDSEDEVCNALKIAVRNFLLDGRTYLWDLKARDRVLEETSGKPKSLRPTLALSSLDIFITNPPNFVGLSAGRYFGENPSAVFDLIQGFVSLPNEEWQSLIARGHLGISKGTTEKIAANLRVLHLQPVSNERGTIQSARNSIERDLTQAAEKVVLDYKATLELIKSEEDKDSMLNLLK